MLLERSYQPARGCVAARWGVSSSSVVEHPTRSQRDVGSNPIWDSDFFRVYVSPRIYLISYKNIDAEICEILRMFLK